MAVEDLSYGDYWQIFRRWWWLAVAAAVAGAFGGVALAKLQTPAPVYDAAASISYDPMAGYELPAGSPPPQQERDLTTQILIIRGTQILGTAAKRLGQIPQNVPRENYERYHDVITALRNRVEVTLDPTGRSGLMAIHGRGASGDEAAGIANAVSLAYRDENTYELKKYILKRREFIEKQLADNERQLNDAQLAYERFRREHPLAALEPGVEGAISDLARREARAQEMAGKLEETNRQLTLVRSGRPISDLGLQAIVGGAHTARLTQLSTGYTQLTLERNQLLTELTDEHPAVQHKTQQIEAVRQEIEDELDLILDSVQVELQHAESAVDDMRKRQEKLPEEAMRLAQLARQVKIHDNIALQLRTQLEDALLKEAGVTGQIGIVSFATPPAVAANAPAYARLGSLGFAGGLFAGFVLAVMIEANRFTLQTLREIEEALAIPVLGVSPSATPETLRAWIPGGGRIRKDSPEWSRAIALAMLLAPRSPVGEAFRTVRANLQSDLGTGPRLFTLTAAGPGEGTTTAATNLALSFAQASQRVLLVESDFRSPGISDLFGLQREPGFTDVLLGAATVEEATRGVADFVTGTLTLDEILLAPGMDELHVMPCGRLSANSSELLTSNVLPRVVAEIAKSYDVLIFDSPSLAIAADAINLGRSADVIVVYNPRLTQRAELEAAVGQLRKAGCRVVGLFVQGLAVESAAPEAEPATARAAL